MPKKYEAIRDQAIKEGMSTKIAKQKAARIFNAGRKPGEAPVTRQSAAEEQAELPARPPRRGAP